MHVQNENCVSFLCTIILPTFALDTHRKRTALFHYGCQTLTNTEVFTKTVMVVQNTGFQQISDTHEGHRKSLIFSIPFIEARFIKKEPTDTDYSGQ